MCGLTAFRRRELPVRSQPRQIGIVSLSREEWPRSPNGLKDDSPQLHFLIADNFISSWTNTDLCPVVVTAVPTTKPHNSSGMNFGPALWSIVRSVIVSWANISIQAQAPGELDNSSRFLRGFQCPRIMVRGAAKATPDGSNACTIH